MEPCQREVSSAARVMKSANPGPRRLSYALSHPDIAGISTPTGEEGFVYPARFEYTAPSTLEEVVAALTERGDEAKVLAGGQSLLPLMKLRFATPGVLVDLNGVPGLDFIEESEGELRIGALVRHKACEKSELLRDRYPLLGAAAPQISDPLVRNRGTVGGSLAHADPQGDWGAVMLAARGSVVARGPDGERTISVDDLLDGPFTTTLSADEVITEVRVPSPGPRSSGTYLKLERKVGDYATAAVAVQVTLDNGTIGEVGIALTGVGPTNIRAIAAEDALRGAEPTDATIADAARLAAEAAQPQSDIRGTAAYKRNVVRVFTERGLRTAVAAATAGEE
jgi:carbon-monoxide dehydrogenase medium subunit